MKALKGYASPCIESIGSAATCALAKVPATCTAHNMRRRDDSTMHTRLTHASLASPDDGFVHSRGRPCPCRQSRLRRAGFPPRINCKLAGIVLLVPTVQGRTTQDK